MFEYNPFPVSANPVQELLRTQTDALIRSQSETARVEQQAQESQTWAQTQQVPPVARPAPAINPAIWAELAAEEERAGQRGVVYWLLALAFAAGGIALLIALL